MTFDDHGAIRGIANETGGELLPNKAYHADGLLSTIMLHNTSEQRVNNSRNPANRYIMPVSGNETGTKRRM